MNWELRKLELLRDDIADVICWHLGFKAANPEYEPPPGLDELKSFGIEIRDFINEAKQ